MLILGLGFVGKHFCHTKVPDAFGTHRHSFLLHDPQTWRNLQTNHEKILWTFPAASTLEEVEMAELFYQKYLKEKKVIVLGTTSSYHVQSPHQWVDESTPVKDNDCRAQAELKLQSLGAVIFRLSGIFGESRNPLDWFLQKRISDPEKFLNLIHVDDICHFLDAAFHTSKWSELSGNVFNITNGLPQKNSDIANKLYSQGWLEEPYIFPATSLSRDMSKRVKNDKIKKYFNAENHLFNVFPPNKISR